MSACNRWPTVYIVFDRKTQTAVAAYDLSMAAEAHAAKLNDQEPEWRNRRFEVQDVEVVSMNPCEV